MKKSKVLKKSLSFLLAVLLVVAMIPFGASAADPTNPLLQELRAGTEGAIAEINQATKTISVIVKPSNSFEKMRISYIAKDGVGNLYYGDGSTAIANNTDQDFSSYETTGVDGIATIPLKIQDPVNPAYVTTYTLTIQCKDVEASRKIEEFTIAGQVGTTFEPGKLAFEILMPYNRDLDASTTAAPLKTNIKLEDAASSHDWISKGLNNENWESDYPDPYSETSVFDLTVTDKNGETQVYQVTVRRAEAVTAFDLKNDDGDALATDVEIVWPEKPSASPVGFGPYTNEDVMTGGEINITLPKNAMNNPDYLKAAIASFESELGDKRSTRLELYDSAALANIKTLDNGVTAADYKKALTSPSTLYIIASYPANDNGQKTVYNLNIEEETSGSRALIKEASVESASIAGMGGIGDIENDVITVPVSKAMDLSNVNLTLSMPADATVEFVIGTKQYTKTATGAAEYNEVNFLAPADVVDLRNPVTLKVTSQDLKTMKTYTLKLVPGEAVNQEAKLKGVYLLNKDTGVKYEADATGLEGVNMTFTVPKSTKKESLDGFVLYYSAPLGSSLKYGTIANPPTLPKSGIKLDSSLAAHFGVNGMLPDTDYTKVNTSRISITTYDDNGGVFGKTDYIVGFKYNDWVEDNKLTTSKFTLTRARVTKEVNADTTYSATIKTLNKTSANFGVTGNVSVAEITVPFVDYNKLAYMKNPIPMQNINIESLGIDPTAALYVQVGTATTDAVRYYPLGHPKYDASKHKLNINASFLNVNDTVVRLFVLSERAVYQWDNAGGTIPVATLTAAGNEVIAAQYFLVVKPAAARSGAGLTSMKMINSKDQERDVTVGTDSVTFNIPYSWAKGDDAKLGTANTNDPDADMFHLSFTGKPGNQLIEITTPGSPITSGGYKTTTTGYESLLDGDVYFQVSATGKLYQVRNVGAAPGTTVANQVQSFQMVDETGAAKSYTVNVKVNPIQSGAEIKSFSVNKVAGTISGDTIKVTLPFASKYDDVAPSFTTSDMATVIFDDTSSEILSDVTKLDFTKTVNLTVKSEDGKASKKYKVIVEAPMQFSDVKPGAWYYDAVMEAASLGFITGYDDGTFKPNNNIKRGDFIKMLANAVGVTDAELDTYTVDPFVDVAITDYYGKQIAWAAANDYVTGYDKADFQPQKLITRQEIAAIFTRVMGLTEIKNPAEADKYKDHKDIGGWAVGYVYALKDAGVMSGHKDGTFTPKNNLTRAQAAQAMVNYYHVK